MRAPVTQQDITGICGVGSVLITGAHLTAVPIGMAVLATILVAALWMVADLAEGSDAVKEDSNGRER